MEESMTLAEIYGLVRGTDDMEACISGPIRRLMDASTRHARVIATVAVYARWQVTDETGKLATTMSYNCAGCAGCQVQSRMLDLWGCDLLDEIGQCPVGEFCSDLCHGDYNNGDGPIPLDLAWTHVVTEAEAAGLSLDGVPEPGK